jgi:hypothetical protein
MAASSTRRAAAPALVAAAGLTLALAAVLGAPGSLSGGARTGLHLPDWLIEAAAASISLASLLLVVMVISPSRRRRRKKDEEEPEHYYEPPKPSVLTIVLLLCLAALPLATLGSLLWAARSLEWESGDAIVPTEHADSAPRALGPPAAPPTPPPAASAPLVDRLYGGLLLLAAVGGLGAVAWLYGEVRLIRLRTASLPPMPARLAHAARASLEDLRLEPDARVAVIKCYRRFEDALAEAAFPRTPSQTPTEFMRAALARLRIPEPALRELTRLFELARFSRRPIGAEDRAAAWQALATVEASLARKAEP